MSSHCLLILSLILSVQNSSCNEGSLATTVRRTNEWQASSNVENFKPQRNETKNAETTNLRSWDGQIALHRRRHLRDMFALCLQPKRENECSRWWKIYHKILGYGLICMIVANIFQGIDHHQGHAEKWKWTYVGILSVLAFSALVLEIFRFVKPRLHQQMAFDINPNIST
ncbi:unnamed protein product [Dovyalis caffra]|uniref:Cytochrome b561 domain-containing protein n=1 Tax=Dovyalis caffra TaxID=77055 RepID=A0AAV1SI92_9ROSI|nr:unnamed protein product [Dovyalis caffra]